MKTKTATAKKCLVHSEGPQHCCAYVEWRDALIPLATEHADRVAGPEPDNMVERHRWSTRWDAEYHREMARLTEDPFTRSSLALMAGARDHFDKIVEVH